MGSVRVSNRNSWTGNSDKSSSMDPNKRMGHNSMDSPLATQLQQAWLQTQLPKRNVPKLDYLSLFPSPEHLQRTPSSNFSSQLSSNQSASLDSYSDVGSSTTLVGSAEVSAESEPMEEDYMLQYLSDILMEEDLVDKKCMYQQCSAYQAMTAEQSSAYEAMEAMTKELADLIGSPAPAENSFYSASTEAAREDEREATVTDWIAEIFNSDPRYFPLGDSDRAEEGSSATPDEASSSSTSDGSRSNDDGLVLPRLEALDLACPYMDGDMSIPKGVDYNNGSNGVESLVDLYPLLMRCAQAIATDDVRLAHQLINQLRQVSSPYGNGGQRMTYYFVEALVARLSGTGARLYTALSSNIPSATEMLKAYRLFVQCNPLPRVSHFFANVSIYKAIEGVERVHIIDFGILYGVQWPCLLRKLAQRPGGPPFVRITGIDFAQPGFHKNERVDETGRRLALKAKEFGVEFEYNAIAGKWENIQASQLNLRSEEVLIVNCMFRLRNLLDETVMASSPRKIVLSKIRSLNPKLFVMGVVSAGYNSPFFMARFRETFTHFSHLFDIIASCVPPDIELRNLAEKEVLGREILNIIACEGTERIERSEPYKQWHSRSVNAGFKQAPLIPEILVRMQEILKPFHRNFGLLRDGNWMLNCWKGHVLHGLTAWVPA